MTDDISDAPEALPPDLEPVDDDVIEGEEVDPENDPETATDDVDEPEEEEE